MPPAKSGVSIDQAMVLLSAFAEHVLDDAATEQVQTGKGQIQDSTRDDIGSLGVHSIANVAKLSIMAVAVSKSGDFFQISTLIQTNGSGNNCSHGSILTN